MIVLSFSTILRSFLGYYSLRLNYFLFLLNAKSLPTGFAIRVKIRLLSLMKNG